MAGDGLAVVITELGLPFRSVTLSGKDRPEQPVQVAGRQRATQTWYPGAGKASTQVLGTEEEPIVLRGWFWDPLSILDGGPAARVALLRGMMQGQNLCQMVWGDAIVRQGRVARCQFEFHRERKIRYEITFAVDQANEAVALSHATGAAGVLADLRPAIDAALRAATNAVETVRVVKTLAGAVRGVVG